MVEVLKQLEEILATCAIDDAEATSAVHRWHGSLASGFYLSARIFSIEVAQRFDNVA